MWILFQVVILNTTETNKTYQKMLYISGNFNTLQETFNINIPYAVIDNSANSTNYQSLLSLIKEYCKVNPTISFCKDTPQIVYAGNTSDAQFNVSYGQQQVRQIYDYIFKQGDDGIIFQNYVKEKLDTMMSNNNNMSETIRNLSSEIRLMKEESESNKNNIFIIILSVIFFLLLACGIVLIYVRKIRVNKKTENWGTTG